MKIIQKRKIFFVISSLLVFTSIIFISLWGLKLGIEFTGGVLMEMKFEGEAPSNNGIIEALSGLNLNSLTVQPSEDNTVLVRFSSDDDSINEQVKKKAGREL